MRALIIQADMKGFRQWLRELLEDGVYPSQNQMAKAWKVSQPAVNAWLDGINQPGLQSCTRIADATGVPVSEIIAMVQQDSPEIATTSH